MQDNKSLKDGKNPKTEGYQQLVVDSITAQDKTALETFRDKSFRDEWKALYAASGVLRWAVSTGSFLTLTACISWGLSFRLPPVLAWGFAGIIASLLEGAKGFLWTKSAKYILKYKSAPALLVGGATVLTGLSLLGGIGGALTAPNPYSAPSSTTEVDSSITSVDLVESGYLDQLAVLDKQAADISTAIANTTSNSTKRTLAATQQGVNQERSKVSASLEQHRSQQLKQREVERSKKEADQAAAKDDQLKESNKQRYIAVFLAVLFDLLQIICFVWGVYYLWRVYAEGATTPTGPQEAPQTHKTHASRNTAGGQPSIVPRTQIGFVQGVANETPNVTTSETPNVKELLCPQTPHGLITDPTRERHCNWCGSVYEYKNDSSKYCGARCRGRMHRYNNRKRP